MDNLKACLEILFEIHPTIKSQADLARKAGYAPNTISDWIKYNRFESKHKAIIAEAFGLSLDDLELPTAQFRDRIRALLSGNTILSSLAKDSPLIELHVLDDFGQFWPVKHVGINRYGLKPASMIKHTYISQNSKIRITVDLNKIHKELRITASDFLLFSESKSETVCLRPSPMSAATKVESKIYQIPEGKSFESEDPLAQVPICVQGPPGIVTSIIVAFLPEGSEGNVELQDLMDELMDLRCNPVDGVIMNKLLALNEQQRIVWLKRTFEVS